MRCNFSLKRFSAHLIQGFVAALLCLSLASQANAQFLRDAEIEQFLKDYSYPLFEAAGIPPESVGVHLINGPPNAFVSNGLNVYVFTGLITLADTPNQIEGVLAHETGHMSGGHLARSDEMMQAATRPMMLSLVLGAVAAAAGSPDAALGIFSLGSHIGTSNALTYSRGQESRADQAAIGFLDSVGSSGVGLQEFFGKLSNRQLISGYDVNPYIQTHPLARNRIVALETRVSASPHKENADTPEEIHRLKMIQAKIHGFIQAPFTTLRQYPLSDQSEPARYARAVAYYRAADLAKATQEIDRLIENDPENPFFWELKGQMLFEHGKVKEAIAPHLRSTELAPQYALLKVNLGRAMVATNDPQTVDEAIKILRHALNMDKENVFGWTELARAYSFRGDNAMAALSQAEAYYNAGALGEAHRFATRASKLLDKQTPEWRQASDIILTSADAARRNQSRSRQRRITAE